MNDTDIVAEGDEAGVTVEGIDAGVEMDGDVELGELASRLLSCGAKGIPALLECSFVQSVNFCSQQLSWLTESQQQNSLVVTPCAHGTRGQNPVGATSMPKSVR